MRSKPATVGTESILQVLPSRPSPSSRCCCTPGDHENSSRSLPTLPYTKSCVFSTGAAAAHPSVFWTFASAVLALIATIAEAFRARDDGNVVRRFLTRSGCVLRFSCGRRAVRQLVVRRQLPRRPTGDRQSLWCGEELPVRLHHDAALTHRYSGPRSV